MAAAADNRRGIFAMLFSASLATTSDMFLRAVTFALPVGEVLATRGLVVMSVMGVAVYCFARASDIRRALKPLVLGRALCEGVMTAMFVLALPHMIFADVMAVFLSSSLIAAALSAASGLERVGIAKWAVLLAGFVGVAMVVRPEFGEINIGAVFALSSAVLIALRDLLTRKIDPATPSVVVTFVSATVVTLLGTGLLAVDPAWRLPAPGEAAMIAAAGLLVAAANFLAVTAYRRADVSVVAPFRYTALPFAIVAAFLVWGEFPDFWSFLGGAAITASSVAAIWMQRRRRT